MSTPLHCGIEVATSLTHIWQAPNAASTEGERAMARTPTKHQERVEVKCMLQCRERGGDVISMFVKATKKKNDPVYSRNRIH